MADITNALRQGRRWQSLIGAACVALVCGSASGAGHGGGGTSGGHGGGHGEGHGAEAAAPFDPTLPRPLDLGVFDLRNFRPTHNEIANIKFNLHVVFPAGTTNEEMAELASWKQRLRDQAITAVRLADAEALNDPQLTKVRRLLLLRLKRMELPKEVVAVYLSDFAVSAGAL
ncbi:MAG: hypothetical protein DCC67_15180 [Planctomycetota bacterium]|nr:MAG: hypothetical protein DCC67_15180 [Planctomycetota bacterium]